MHLSHGIDASKLCASKEVFQFHWPVVSTCHESFMTEITVVCTLLSAELHVCNFRGSSVADSHRQEGWLFKLHCTCQLARHLVCALQFKKTSTQVCFGFCSSVQDVATFFQTLAASSSTYFATVDSNAFSLMSPILPEGMSHLE